MNVTVFFPYKMWQWADDNGHRKAIVSDMNRAANQECYFVWHADNGRITGVDVSAKPEFFTARPLELAMKSVVDDWTARYEDHLDRIEGL